MRTQVRSTIDSIKSCGEPFCSPYGFGSRRLRLDGDSEKLLVVEAHTMMIYRIPFTRLAPRNPAAMHRLDRISNSAYIYVERYRRVGGFDQNLRSAHLNQEKCLMELRPNSLDHFTGAEAPQKAAGLQAFERHYTVSQLSKLWYFSESTIRRLFIQEPGVITIAHKPTKVRRGYTSLRIPERIAQRVHRRLQGLS